MSFRRVYHPYHDWEDWRAGVWRIVRGDKRRAALVEAIAFTGDAVMYGSYMRRVIVEWPKACEHNLTERSMNRLAWLGHAAACMAIGVPEDVTREAWSHLTQEQRDAADEQAAKAVKQWEKDYSRKDTQLRLFVEV